MKKLMFLPLLAFNLQLFASRALVNRSRASGFSDKALKYWDQKVHLELQVDLDHFPMVLSWKMEEINKPFFAKCNVNSHYVLFRINNDAILKGECA